jgi:acetyl-CoA acyltransferase
MGEFAPEIIPAVIWSQDSCVVVNADESIADVVSPTSGLPLFYDPDIARRYPEIGWRLHAGNVSQPAIGAAAAILIGSERAAELGFRPRARIISLAE